MSVYLVVCIRGRCEALWQKEMFYGVKVFLVCAYFKERGDKLG